MARGATTVVRGFTVPGATVTGTIVTGGAGKKMVGRSPHLAGFFLWRSACRFGTLRLEHFTVKWVHRKEMRPLNSLERLPF